MVRIVIYNIIMIVAFLTWNPFALIFYLWASDHWNDWSIFGYGMGIGFCFIVLFVVVMCIHDIDIEGLIRLDQIQKKPKNVVTEHIEEPPNNVTTEHIEEVQEEEEEEQQQQEYVDLLDWN